jgi:hypothetical protein
MLSIGYISVKTIQKRNEYSFENVLNVKNSIKITKITTPDLPSIEVYLNDTLLGSISKLETRSTPAHVVFYKSISAPTEGFRFIQGGPEKPWTKYSPAGPQRWVIVVIYPFRHAACCDCSEYLLQGARVSMIIRGVTDFK